MMGVRRGAGTGGFSAVFGALLMAAFLPVGCGSEEGDPPDESMGGSGDGDDPLAGLDEGEGPEPDLPVVTAAFETEQVNGFGDAADDPAIWVHPTEPEKSLIFGSDKTTSGGLFVYDLSGNEVDFFDLGELNNIDLRSGFQLGDREVTLITATNRTHDSLEILALDHETLEITNVAQGTIETITESYGLCMYKSPEGKFYSFVNSALGDVLQFELIADGEEVTAQLVRQFCVETQPEGCVVDDAAQRIFLGEESFGLWVFPAEEGAPSTGDTSPACEGAIPGTEVASTFDGVLTRDVEGVAIAATGADSGYLVVSAQGAHEYVMFDRNPPYDHVLTFAVWGGGESCIDGVEETDGLDVVTADMGPDFPEGLLVVQDGFNGDPLEKQNFKLVSWADVLALTLDPDSAFTNNEACNLGDYGGKPRYADLPPGPEITEEFCAEFCARCSVCYEEGGEFAEGDCHYKSPKPTFDEPDCLEGCIIGVSPSDTRPLQEGWQEWDCLDLDDAL